MHRFSAFGTAETRFDIAVSDLRLMSPCTQNHPTTQPLDSLHVEFGPATPQPLLGSREYRISATRRRRHLRRTTLLPWQRQAVGRRTAVQLGPSPLATPVATAPATESATSVGVTVSPTPESVTNSPSWNSPREVFFCVELVSSTNEPSRPRESVSTIGGTRSVIGSMAVQHARRARRRGCRPQSGPR